MSELGSAGLEHLVNVLDMPARYAPAQREESARRDMAGIAERRWSLYQIHIRTWRGGTDRSWDRLQLIYSQCQSSFKLEWQYFNRSHSAFLRVNLTVLPQKNNTPSALCAKSSALPLLPTWTIPRTRGRSYHRYLRIAYINDQIGRLPFSKMHIDSPAWTVPLGEALT